MSGSVWRRVSLLLALAFFCGMVAGFLLPRLNIWPYSACHGLGGAIHITRYESGGDHGMDCVIPWRRGH